WRREARYRSPEVGCLLAHPRTGDRLGTADHATSDSSGRAVTEHETHSWHTFRHSYSSLLCHAGTNLRVMQEVLRHYHSLDLGQLHAGGDSCKTRSSKEGGHADFAESKQNARRGLMI